MGNGNWSDNAYNAAATFRSRSGVSDFGYSDSTRSLSRAQWKAQTDLDPKGVTVRESRDSAEHPESTPMAVLFDVTGSMGSVPVTMQKQLAKLHGLLLRKGYATDPQIMFGAIGDADTDRVPLQVGQFESDNRMDEQLRNIFLEGNGGGQKSESYELAAYFLARHTATDSWEKRGRKGYLFIIGDELNKPRLQAKHIRNIIGDDVHEDIDVASIYRELQEKWEVFFILPKQTSYFDDPQVRGHWKGILNERVLFLDDPAAVCDLIGVTVGMLEQVVDLDEGLADLADVGSSAGGAVGRALAPLAGSAVASATTTATLPANLTGPGDDLA
ncbi:Uncharacterised protein (plasmid) [Tsukamurella tyrosinosolvens]|uniref:VWFA domain-containing protein n=1 Tax=Tsukamurella tyrosinosolvens TaxID=57704 RepID=A0A1H4UKY1_TSUTY|nr:hypothetical protein [Tsukamurella tyrosinosolvens]KXO99057.1 hypothetical protein AXK58_24185 [Tsukamurella tyrosinosolvens]SEC69416.1 hypothetical protein SAMN04489793_2940 [Tsukamurella tyrosinosolvens]VEH94325.1 Uncharacterised protein [Tsukamurella tyrosinosolvens]